MARHRLTILKFKSIYQINFLSRILHTLMLILLLLYWFVSFLLYDQKSRIMCIRASHYMPITHLCNIYYFRYYIYKYKVQLLARKINISDRRGYLWNVYGKRVGYSTGFIHSNM